MLAVCIANPGPRKLDSDPSFKPIPSPMHDLAYRFPFYL